MSTSDDDFMAGTRALRVQARGAPFGTVENRGSITAQGGGTVALIGAQVSNSGSIVAQTAAPPHWLSGDTVTVDFAGDGLTTFRVSPGALRRRAPTAARCRPMAGAWCWWPPAGSESRSGVVNTRGVLRADSLASRNGEIILDSGSRRAACASIGGALSAAGNGAGLHGRHGRHQGPHDPAACLRPRLHGVIAAPAALPGSDDRGSSTPAARRRRRIGLHATAVGGDSATRRHRGGRRQHAARRRDRRRATAATFACWANAPCAPTARCRRGAAPDGGNGGFIETSGGFAAPRATTGGGIDLDGIRVDASAPARHGRHAGSSTRSMSRSCRGVAAGSLPANPFEPLATSTIQDGDINAALNGGTSVRITTGDPAAGAATDGDIVLDGVRIDYSRRQGPAHLPARCPSQRAQRRRRGDRVQRRLAAQRGVQRQCRRRLAAGRRRPGQLRRRHLHQRRQRRDERRLGSTPATTIAASA